MVWTLHLGQEAVLTPFSKLGALSWAKWHLFLPTEVSSLVKPGVCWAVSTIVAMVVVFKVCTKVNGLALMSQAIRNQCITYVTDKIDIGSTAWVQVSNELAHGLTAFRQALPALTAQLGHHGSPPAWA